MNNKKLCELLGIEPKYRVEALGDYHYFDSFIQAESYYNSIYAVYAYGGIEEVHVDFHEPDNFVKLIEELYRFEFNCEELETYRESILQGLIYKLENDNNFKEEFTIIAQKVTWKY